MPGALKYEFRPFRNLKPDRGLLLNDGLSDARGVVPAYESYIATKPFSPVAFSGAGPFTEIYGLHAHHAGGTAWYAYFGESDDLYEMNWVFTTADKSRLVGGAYNTAGAGGENGWQGASFGDAVIMTNYVDDPQLLTSPAAGNFVKLAQSGAGNPGMDPKAKFVFAVRGNLFLANLNLAAGFDTLAAGANPTAVCWSQSENIRQYGSFNVTPQLTGTGYQPLNYDFGHITGGIGGDYGLVFFQTGIVRVDGPPYMFRPIVIGQGCRFPNSIVQVGEDVYFWSTSGPARLRGGEGPLEPIGRGQVARTLIDDSTGYSLAYALESDPAVPLRHVSGGRDLANGLVWWSYTPTTLFAYGQMSVIYNITEDRFSFSLNAPGTSGVTFLRTLPDLGGQWMPGRDLIGIYTTAPTGSTWSPAMPDFAAAGQQIQISDSYRKLNEEVTTRIVRVRPVYARASGAGPLPMTISIDSRNNLVQFGAVLTLTSIDSHGWYTAPASSFAEFHGVFFLIPSTASGTETITELKGYEIEYELGPRYSQ